MGSFFVLLLGFHQAFAGPYFTTLRDDLNVPEKCREMKLSFYKLPAEKIFAGRQGAKSMGYTMEYPVTRSNATVLWKYFRSLVKGEENLNLKNKILRDSALKRDYEIILKSYSEADFDFANEGEVLELLVIDKLYKEFPENHYYITGGVEYHKEYSPQTIGEVDLFVGYRETCESVVVGEVKLGTKKMLNKAKRQLSRFENFLIEHNASGFGDEYPLGLTQ